MGILLKYAHRSGGWLLLELKILTKVRTVYMCICTHIADFHKPCIHVCCT